MGFGLAAGACAWFLLFDFAEQFVLKT